MEVMPSEQPANGQDPDRYLGEAPAVGGGSEQLLEELRQRGIHPMEVEITNLEKLDLKQLRQLVALKENSKQLTKLENRRQRLKKELEETETEIRHFLGQYPEVREFLAASGAVSGRRLTASGRRPRGWVQDQVQMVLEAATGALTPAEIRDRVAERHPEEATKNLYLAIFQHLRRRDQFEQVENGGWQLTDKDSS